MANHVSALKRVRITERRTLINRMRKTRLRHQVRMMRRVLEQKDTANAEKVLSQTFSVVDRAAKWGIIKKNTASRYKSRLHLRVKALGSAAA